MTIKEVVETLEHLRQLAEEMGTSAELAEVRVQEALWEALLDKKIKEILDAP